MKAKSLKQAHAAKMYKLNTPPIAIYSMGVFYGIGAFEIRYNVDDKIKVAWLHEGDTQGKLNERSAYRWLKIRYDAEGDAYIFMAGERRYLKDFY